jgi:hypothetical protein
MILHLVDSGAYKHLEDKYIWYDVETEKRAFAWRTASQVIFVYLKYFLFLLHKLLFISYHYL